MTCFIQFGFFNKKLLLPFGIAFFQILINIMNGIIPENPKNPILEMIGTGLGEIAIIIIPLYNKSLFKTNSNNRINTSCKTFLHYLLLFLIFSTFLGLNIYITIINNSDYQINKSSFLILFKYLSIFCIRHIIYSLPESFDCSCTLTYT